MHTSRIQKLQWGYCTVCAASLIATSRVCATDTPPPVLTIPATHAIQPASQPSAAPEKNQPYQFKLSARDLDGIIAKHNALATEKSAAQLEEVVVTSPTELLPLHSPTREVWGGLAAPFWAIAHPTQAWRILMPIPAE